MLDSADSHTAQVHDPAKNTRTVDRPPEPHRNALYKGNFSTLLAERPEERAELVQEVVANAFVAFARLVELGRREIVYATPLAGYAIRQVLGGRRVGSRLNKRDVMSPANRRVAVESLERFDRGDDRWQELLVEEIGRVP